MTQQSIEIAYSEVSARLSNAQKRITAMRKALEDIRVYSADKSVLELVERALTEDVSESIHAS